MESSSVNPISEGVYEWHLSTGADSETQTNLAVKGRANSKERPYVYLYGEEADKTASDVHNICIVNFDCLRRLLHRLLSDKQGVLEKSKYLPEIGCPKNSESTLKPQRLSVNPAATTSVLNSGRN